MTILSLMTGETMAVQIQTVNAEVLFDRPIKALGNSAGVYVPKKHLGKKAIVIIIENEEKKEGENGKISG